jgi:glycosyltransferase involved in cell wall biosynthesis
LKSLSVSALPRYSRLGASARLRIWQYLPYFRHAQWIVQSEPFIERDELEDRYAQGHYTWRTLAKAYCRRWRVLRACQAYQVVWIEKEALPWMPLCLEKWMLRGVPYVLDYDDAVFHQYDQHPNFLVRRLYGRRIDGLMAGAALVVAGNNYLAGRARQAGARRIEVLPTVIDLERYPKPLSREAFQAERLPRIVWIGSPTTAPYLKLLFEPLRVLSLQVPFILRVIGSSHFEIPGVQLEVLAWSEDTEVDNINACDIGIMPLPDTPWEQGKCGYKLIQYMACGLPVVASPVGANVEIVQQGENGFLATSDDEWVSALTKLLQSRTLRSEMGALGRKAVEEKYCLQKTGPILVSLLRSVAQEGA